MVGASGVRGGRVPQHTQGTGDCAGARGVIGDSLGGQGASDRSAWTTQGTEEPLSPSFLGGDTHENSFYSYLFFGKTMKPEERDSLDFRLGSSV